MSHIEVLVLVTAVVMVVRYILDVIFGRRISSKVFLNLVNMFATLPVALNSYTIAQMQLTKSNNDVYQVWAVVLVTILYSIRAVRPTGIFGKQNPLQDMMQSLWTANLLGTRTTLLKIPLWLLWSLNSVRIILGFADTELTSSRHGRHLLLLTEYMRTEHQHSSLEDCDATHMKGYKYLVHGENKQMIKSEPPEYRVRLEVTKEKKFITTNKVWETNGALLGEPSESNELKDLCLAFALSKLLRRRLFGLPIYEANQQKSKELVLKGLIQNDNYDRAFEIIEAELAFVSDYFFTRYAVMFARGFPFLRLFLSLSVIGVALHLSVIFYYSRGRLAGDLSKTTNGIAVTWALLFILAIKEIWEMVTYVMSNWTKVVLISNYVQQPFWTRCAPIVASMKLLCKIKIVNRWHGKLWQYSLFQSFRYTTKLNPLCTGMQRFFLNYVVRIKLPGYKGSSPIKLSEEVKSAISKSLQGFCNQPEDMGKYLSTVANSFHPDLEQKISQTSEFATETQKILVWHIATSYCEIKLAKTSQNTGTQSHYKVAIALSQYSAYLPTLPSPLLPDRSLVATQLLRSTLDATRDLLCSCNSWVDVLDKLDNLGKDNDAVGGCTDDDKNDNDDVGGCTDDDKDDNNDNDAVGGCTDDDKDDKNDNDDVGGCTDDDKDDKNDNDAVGECTDDDDKDDKNDGGGNDGDKDDKNGNNDEKDDKDGDPNLSKWEKKRQERQEKWQERRKKRQEIWQERRKKRQERQEKWQERRKIRQEKWQERRKIRQEKWQERREKRLEKERAKSRIMTEKIIKVGVKLGGSLLELLLVKNENENETCVDTKLWEFLEIFWTRYLLHLAGSISPTRHKQSLSGGAQFITHVWALLFHAGLLGKTDQDRRFKSMCDLKYPDEIV